MWKLDMKDGSIITEEDGWSGNVKSIQDIESISFDIDDKVEIIIPSKHGFRVFDGAAGTLVRDNDDVILGIVTHGTVADVMTFRPTSEPTTIDNDSNMLRISVKDIDVIRLTKHEEINQIWRYYEAEADLVGGCPEHKPSAQVYGMVINNWGTSIVIYHNIISNKILIMLDNIFRMKLSHEVFDFKNLRCPKSLL